MILVIITLCAHLNQAPKIMQMIIDITNYIVDNEYHSIPTFLLWSVHSMFRYLSAGLVSVAIHFFIFAPLFDKPAMAFPINQQSQSVSLRFSAVTKPAPKKADTPTKQVKTTPPPPVEKAAPKAVKADTPAKTTKKRIVKEKTKAKKIAKKVTKQTPKKPVKKTPKKIAKVEKKPEPIKPVKKVEEVKKPEKPVEVAKADLVEPVLTEEAPAVAAAKTAPVENVTENKEESLNQDGLQDKPQLIEKSRFLSSPNAPKYPRIAKRKGLEGTVTYEVWLDEKGKQIKQLLKDSSGARVLDVAALKAIKTWKFSPHSVNGKKIAHRIYVPISFKLD